MKHQISLTALFALLISVFPASAQPDSNYFQQQVNHTIRVKLNDVNHTISGFETVEYTNHSPHVLKYIYFHIWPNAYKNNETQLAKQKLESGDLDFYFAPESERGFIDSLLFKVGNDTLKWEYHKEKIKKDDPKSKEVEFIDIVKVTLKRPLKPDSTVTITTPFFVKIPSGEFSRLGHIGQSYQITQWFPKPAVYDKNGWNPIPYLNQGEFYSEYGNYDVTITVPANYLVAATGELTGCPQEERMLELKAKETKQLFDSYKVNKVGNLIGDNLFPPSSSEWKTLRFVQKNVHDFAWFADKRWYVLKGEYEFKNSGKLVSLWAFFTTGSSKYWKKSIQYLHDAVHYYSKWNGDYPYSIVTAVDGTISAGGGMEYPTITNIGNVNTDVELETVIMHEVGHNWFYGILGSNERLHPWMDEGMNSANEMRYMYTKYPEMLLNNSINIRGVNRFLGIDSLKQKMQYYLAYKLSAITNNDQPIEEKAHHYTDFNYGAIVYMKSAAAFNFLKAYLGDDLYDKCMHAYFDAWKFKHPQPNDLQKIFEKTAKKDLSWFFEELIKTNEIIDYKITKKKKPDTRSTKTFGWMKYEEGVEVKNVGSINAPFCVAGYRADTIADIRWYSGFKGRFVVSFPNGNYERIVIDPFNTAPEINHDNNAYKYKIKGKKLFARTEKLKMKWLIGYDDRDRSTLFYSPVLGYNTSDGAMVGMAFYNSFFFQKPVEWSIMPLYAIGSQQPNGSMTFALNSNYRKSSWLKSTTFGMNAAKYSSDYINGNMYDYEERFFRIEPYFALNLKPRSFRSPLKQSVTLRSYLISETSDMTCETCDSLNSVTTTTVNTIFEIQYKLISDKTLMPSQFNFMTRVGNGFSLVTADYTLSKILNVKKKKITARVYAGAFLSNTTNDPRYNLRGDGVRGYYDYTYSTIFVGRNDVNGLWRQQFAEGFANMKAPTAYGQSNEWNAGLNLYSDLPIPFFKIFADVAVAPGAGELNVVADAGVYANIIPNVLTIYVPFWVSRKIADEYEVNDIRFGERIRFTLSLNHLAPQRFSKSIKLF